MRLLQRTTRNVGLTEAGVHFIAKLKPAFHGIDVAFESLSALRGRPPGLLRLTMLRTGYSDVLKPKLASFLAAYPDIRIDLSGAAAPDRRQARAGRGDGATTRGEPTGCSATTRGHGSVRASQGDAGQVCIGQVRARQVRAPG